MEEAHQMIREVSYLWLAPVLPALGAVFGGVFGAPREQRLGGHGHDPHGHGHGHEAHGYDKGHLVINLVACGTVFTSFVISVIAFFTLKANPETTALRDYLFDWINTGRFRVELAFMADHLSIIMMLVVTGVGFLIHVYSTGYMAHDPSHWRFFSHLNLFIFAMLLLVMGDNLLIMFIGWEGVGLCSYLLISFWYTSKANAVAGMKAFVVNRIGDFGFLVGIFILFWTVGDATGDYTVNFYKLSEHAAAIVNVKVFGVGAVTLATLCLFVGATGKSAQIPLYVWLPDAMAGPTPVSALIHAATMVTAGVYMIGRMNVFFSLAPVTLAVVGVVATATALVAATIGILQNDIKKVLAYSTVSQLGYMFMGMAAMAYAAGIFHLMTHAFFKALLFLGAGSVIHAMSDEQDMRKMGGLAKYMPHTAWTFLMATIAISGIWPFSGFFSKDEILFKVFNAQHFNDVLFPHASQVLWAVGYITAGMTAFYMFRLFFMTFTGKCRADKHTKEHLHESPWNIVWPLIVLAVLAICGGWIGWPKFLGGGAHFEHWLDTVFAAGGAHEAAAHAEVLGAEAAHGHELLLEWLLAGASVFIAVCGILLAAFFYIKHTEKPKEIAERWPRVYDWVYNKYRVDEFYQATVIRGLMALKSALGWFDKHVIDWVVNFCGTLLLAVKSVAGWVDSKGVDGLGVEGVAWTARFFGQVAQKVQTGRVQTYLALSLVGLLLVFLYAQGGGTLMASLKSLFF